VRTRIERVVDVAVPAAALWDHVTDWPRQQEWVPMTRVERIDDADALGGRFRAWTGLGRPSGPGRLPRGVGFWDPMTITAWERSTDGGGRCEVLHQGRVVRGEGEFTVLALDDRHSRFLWAEVLVLPVGRLGAAGWRLARPVVERLLDRALHTLRDVAEAEAAVDPSRA
jgi:hypothetical protein